MEKIRPPFIYDSLDVSNAPHKDHSKPITRLEWKVIACILLFALILIVGLFIYVIRSLNERAEYGDTFSRLLLVALNTAVVIAIIAALVGGVLMSLQWLYHWAKKNGLLSLNDGPHYNINNVKTKDYDQLFESFALRLFDVIEQRAKESRYQGVSTLTIDESKHVHMKKDGKDIPEGDTIEETDAPVAFLLDEQKED